MNSTQKEIVVDETGFPVELAKLQSVHTANQRARPPPVEIPQDNEAQTRTPLSPHRESLREQRIQRRTSKGGLRSLFTRVKLDKPSITSPIEEDFTVSALPERTVRNVAGSSTKRSSSLRRNMNGLESPATPMSPIRPNPHIRITTAPTKTPSKPIPSPLKSPGKVSPGKVSPGKASPRPPTRGSAAWDPPPLFQAYPQAIKHAQLAASTLSADSILRINNSQKDNSVRNEIALARTGQAIDPDAARKAAKTKSKHRRQISGSISKAEWTQKIFVLVTSGYLLQYAGDGSFDRLPEKMMQLGKDSVAFASDVIPGKHWVLQISQAMDSDGTPSADSRSFFSRLTFRGADYRRSTASLLLVLDSPEDMEQWLRVVRREIEALGGKKHVSETGKVKLDDNFMHHQAQPSHRYQVARDPDLSSMPPTPRLPEFNPPWAPQQEYHEEDIHARIDDAVGTRTSPQLPIVTSMAGERSVTNSVVSHAEEQLDNLRDGSNRFSYMSSGQRTVITTEDSTPTNSPTCALIPGFDTLPSMKDFKFPSEVSTARPNSSAINERRRSMQTFRTPTIDVPPPPKHYRHSIQTYVGTARNVRINAAPIQNFSVPSTSSKRWSQPTPTPRNETLTILIPAAKKRDSCQDDIPEIETPEAKDFRPLSPVQDASPEFIKQAKYSSKAPNKELLPIPKADADTKPTRQVSSLMPLPLSLRETRSHHELRAAASSTHAAPPLPLTSTPESTPARKHSKPPPAMTNPKKERRPFSLQVSTLPFVGLSSLRSPALRSPAITPSSPLTIFPPSKPFASNSRSASPVFNESVLTTVTVLSPSPPTPSQSHFPKPMPSPYQPRANSALGNRSRPRPAFLTQNNNSASSLSSPLHSPLPRLPLPRQDSSTVTVTEPALTPRSAVQTSSRKELGTRRSLPSLVNGPPDAPPPDCALPPLPPMASPRLGG